MRIRLNQRGKIIRKIAALILRAVLSTIWLGFLIIFLWAFCFRWYCLCVLLLLAVVAFLPLKIKQRIYIKTRLILLGFMIFLSISTFEISVNELNNRIAQLAAKPRDRLSAFSLRDKVGIYGLNVIMGVVAYPLYPEASIETLLMLFKESPNSKRIFESDFALSSARVRNVLEGFRENLETHPGDKAELKTRIAWPFKDYAFGNKEARYALALNPADLSVSAVKPNAKWDMEVRLQVKCEYPKNSLVTLIAKPELKVEEGLFWVLQQAGWLHPYMTEYQFHVKAQEKRIRQE